MTTKQISLSGPRYQNWHAGGEPPVVLNPSADLHALIAWCWGEAVLANQLAINAQCYEQNLVPLIDAIQDRLAALETVLKALGERTEPRTGGAA